MQCLQEIDRMWLTGKSFSFCIESGSWLFESSCLHFCHLHMSREYASSALNCFQRPPSLRKSSLWRPLLLQWGMPWNPAKRQSMLMSAYVLTGMIGDVESPVPPCLVMARDQNKKWSGTLNNRVGPTLRNKRGFGVCNSFDTVCAHKSI